MPVQSRNPKYAIIAWSVLGALIGWILAAWAFLERSEEFFCAFLGLSTMLAFSLYGSRRHRSLYSRIIPSVLIGGLFVSLLRPVVSERVADRTELIFRGFGPGAFSGVPYGLTGGLLFLVVMLATSPRIESRDNTK